MILKCSKGMIQLIKQLFVNSAILIAALFTVGQHFSGKSLDYHSRIKSKIIMGVMSGIVGVILVMFGVQITDSIVVDFRYLALIVSAIYGGPLATILGGLIIAGFRALYIGISYSSIIAALFVLSDAAGCSIISKIKYTRKVKWILMVFYSIINSFFALKVVIPNYNDLIRAFIPYSLSFVLLGFLVYYYAGTISVSNNLVRNLKEETRTDFLTELNNVRSFDILYNASIKNAEQRCENLSVILIDIDYFKNVNDTYGHQAGDSILKQVGEILKQGCRSFDIVSRNGGEEFSMILMNCPGAKAYDIAERIRKRVEEHKFVLNDSTEINITLSLGIATYPEAARDSQALFKNADKALYKAKNNGRNRVCYFKSDSSIYCSSEETNIAFKIK